MFNTQKLFFIEWEVKSFLQLQTIMIKHSLIMIKEKRYGTAGLIKNKKRIENVEVK